MTAPATHRLAPPPQQDPEVAQVAAILATGLATPALATGLASFLSIRGIRRPAIELVLRLTEPGTNHQARIMGQDAQRRMAIADLYFRASYVMNAARRIQASLDAGRTEQQALNAERRYFQMHEQARRVRRRAAIAIDEAASLFGPQLGWYLNPLLNNDPECIAANGHNFDADTPPAIGWPGMVHSGCGCRGGPPIAGAGSVDSVTAHFAHHTAKKPKLYKVAA